MGLANFFGRFGRQFSPEDVSRAYKQLFTSQLALDHVLPDLAEFCKAAEPAPVSSDMWVQARHAGWRDVFLHIQEMVDMTDEQVRALYISRAQGAR